MIVQVRACGVGKAYKRYAHKSGRLREWVGFPDQHELVWVLRDVSFEMGTGESVGIVGANGAGKSTLLKIIAGTVKPTHGKYELAGRVAALLELGIGFDPNFSGRQNVHMAGHLAGVSARQMSELMPDIEAFAEIGDAIDQPVRTYSSGMQVRLAFTVATAIRPDILIVDEALSVGDVYFQHKSFDRIRQFRDQGTTLLFVSHSFAAVKTLCDRVMLFDQGLLIRDGEPDAVLDYYNALIATQREGAEIRQSRGAGGRVVTRSGNEDAVIESVTLLSNGKATQALRSGEAVTVRVDVTVRAWLPELTVGMLIRDRLGNDVYGTNTHHLECSRTDLRPGDRLRLEFEIASLALGAGSYSLTAALHARDVHTAANYDWWDRAIVFQVTQGPGPLGIGVCVFPVEAAWIARDAADKETVGFASGGSSISRSAEKANGS